MGEEELKELVTSPSNNFLIFSPSRYLRMIESGDSYTYGYEFRFVEELSDLIKSLDLRYFPFSHLRSFLFSHLLLSSTVSKRTKNVLLLTKNSKMKSHWNLLNKKWWTTSKLVFKRS